MALANGSEDWTRCAVCSCEFDEWDRKPKFIPCSHTLCLLCLKVSIP